MLIYWLLLLSIIAVGVIFMIGSDQSIYYNEIKKNVFLTFSGILLFIVSGFRGPFVGTDTLSYFNIYDLANYQSFAKLLEVNFGVEKGYLLLNKIIGNMFDNRQSIIIFTSFVIIWGVLYFIEKNSSDVWMSVFLFVTLYYFGVSMNIVRQFMALSVFFIAYEQLKQNRNLLYILLIWLASTLHSSAWILLVLLILNKIKPNLRNMKVIFLGAIVITTILYILPSIILDISGKYIVYEGTKYIEGNSVGGIVIVWLSQVILYFCSMFIIKNKNNISESEKKSIFLYSVMVLISVCIRILSTQIFLIHRLSFYFEIFMIVLIPNVVNLLVKERLLVKFLICLILALYFYYNLTHAAAGIVPYEFMW